jgi:hypothetical protein
MLTGRHTARLFVLILAILMLPHHAPAQADSGSHVRLVREAYNQVNTWVRAWQLPPESSLALPGVQGVVVTLRSGGVVVGRGVALRPSASLNDPDRDAPNLLVDATRLAMREARPRLPVERDALAEDALLLAAGSLVLSVELAGICIPIDARTVTDVTAWTQTTEWGLAVLIDDKLTALFPSEMRQTALTGEGALRVALGEHAILTANLPQLFEQNRATIYRFHTVERAQPGPGQPSRLMHRGSTVVELRDVRRASLADAAAQLAAHMQSRLWPGEEPFGLLPLYQPWTDSADPSANTTAQDALAAYALLRFAAAPDIAEIRREQATATAVELLTRANERRLRSEGQLSSLEAAAAIVLACTEIDPGELTPACSLLLGEAMELISAVLASEPAVQAVLEGPLASRGLVALALARLEVKAPDRFPVAQVTAHLEATWAGIPAETLVSAMPFLGWAELEHAAATREPVRAAALRAMRARVWQHQREPGPLNQQDRDLEGGIVFSLNRQAYPTSATLRPLGFLCTMLGDPMLTETRELPSETFRVLRTVRFFLQLTMRESDLYMARNPLRARGGVREAVWDNRMPIDASSLGLLCLVEMLETFETLEKRLPAPE